MVLHSEALGWCFIYLNSVSSVALPGRCYHICLLERKMQLGRCKKCLGLYRARQLAEPAVTPGQGANLPFSYRKPPLKAHIILILELSSPRLGFSLLAAPFPSLQTQLGYGTEED